MQSDDYRLTCYCDEYRIQEQKADLTAAIAEAHPRAESAYNAIRGDQHLREQFAAVYRNRCAYCGLPVECIGKEGFHVDHIVSRSVVHKGEASVAAGVDSVENLAFSCHQCNLRKGDFVFDESCHSTLSPDRGLGSTFCRDDDLRIVISGEFSDSGPVLEFYKRMRFSDELRRIDYVLASLLDMREHLCNSELSNRNDVILCIDAAIGMLLPSRNAK